MRRFSYWQCQCFKSTFGSANLTARIIVTYKKAAINAASFLSLFFDANDVVLLTAFRITAIETGTASVHQYCRFN